MEITEVDPKAAFPEGVSSADGGLALVYVWVGGSCDTRALLTFERLGGGYRLLTRTEVRAGDCDAMGHPRQIRVRLSEPVDAATVVVQQGQP